MKQTPQEFYSARHEASLNTALALEQAAIGRVTVERRNIQALADRIRLCGSKANIWRCDEAINYSTGEQFMATGTYWRCGSKLCANCVAIKARENRAKLRKAIQGERKKRGERLQFITFTIKNPNLSLRATRELVDRAWQLMRKRLTFVSLFRGGAKAEEFTLTANGYHYHLHLLAIATYYRYNILRACWTECVAKAFDEANVPFDVMTSDGNLIVKVLPVTDLEGSIQEVCKYLTKSDSWRKLRSRDIAEVALIPRWYRMFELFGCLNNRIGSRKATADVVETSASPKGDATSDSSTIVHTEPLIDAGSVADTDDWRRFSAFNGREPYRVRLAEEFERARKHRIRQLSIKYEQAPIVDLFPSFAPHTTDELAHWLRGIVHLPVPE